MGAISNELPPGLGNSPWYKDFSLSPCAPLKPIASAEALDAAEMPLAPEVFESGETVAEPETSQPEPVKEKPKAKPTQKPDKKKAGKDVGKAVKPAEVGQAGTRTPEQKMEQKARMLADIGRRMNAVMEEARQGGTEPVFTPIRDWGPMAVLGEEKMMKSGRHGSSKTPLQSCLRWGCDRGITDKICNFNRKEAEPSGYFGSTRFLNEANAEYEQDQEVQFFDSNTGNLLFTAPRGREWQDFIVETERHGWPSFRDEEVNWDKVRVLPDGEAISTNGTHLGHNLPDMHGNRFCINLVSVAGTPIPHMSHR